MLDRVLTLRFDPRLEAFDEGPYRNSWGAGSVRNPRSLLRPKRGAAPSGTRHREFHVLSLDT